MADPLTTSNLAALALLARGSSHFELGNGTFGQQVLPNPKTGVDPCEVWCSQPVERLKEYCNVIKIKVFWSLFFTEESISFLAEHGTSHISSVAS